MATVVSSLIGVNLTRTDTTAVFPLGTLVNLSDGGQAMYVKASTSALSTFGACLIGANGIAMLLTTTNAAAAPGGAGVRVGFAQVSIATSNYGWVQTGGSPMVELATSCAQSVPLFTTSTAGVLDDATITAGYLAGCFLQTTISTATAGTLVAIPCVFIGGYGMQH